MQKTIKRRSFNFIVMFLAITGVLLIANCNLYAADTTGPTITTNFSDGQFIEKNSQYQLTATATDSSGVYVIGYTVKNSSGSTIQTFTYVSGSTISFKIPQNRDGYMYFEITASDKATPRNATTKTYKIGVRPDAPTGFSMASSTNSTATFTWNQLSGYKYRDQIKGSTTNWIEVQPPAQGITSPYTKNKLSSDYYIRIYAVTSDGVESGDGYSTGYSSVNGIFVPAESLTLVTGVSLNKTSMTLQVGGSETLTATVDPSNASNKNVTWGSNNTSVATVDSSGKVTAVGGGTAQIIVTTVDGNKMEVCTVTVPIPVSSVSLTGSSMTLVYGGPSGPMTATVTPSNATNKNVSWSSSNPNVASVSSTGVVSPVNAGSATITVTTVDGNKTDSCAVTVNKASQSAPDAPVASSITTNSAVLTCSTSGATIVCNGVAKASGSTWDLSSSTTYQIYSCMPATANYYQSSNTYGEAFTTQGTATKISSIGLTNMALIPGGSGALTATITPSNASNQNLTWSSSSSLVTVSGSGSSATVTALSSITSTTTATITATAQDGSGASGNCTVTVTPTTVSVTGVSLSSSTLSLVTGGAAQTLIATILPSNASNQNVTWSSSSTSVATVSLTGVVTPVSAGTTVITVTTVDGGKTAQCTVTVTAAKPTINTPTASGTGTYGDAVSISATGTNIVQAKYRIFYTTSTTAPTVATGKVDSPGSEWTDSGVVDTLTVNSTSDISGTILGSQLNNTTWTYETFKVAVSSVTGDVGEWDWKYTSAYKLSKAAESVTIVMSNPTFIVAANTLFEIYVLGEFEGNYISNEDSLTATKGTNYTKLEGKFTGEGLKELTIGTDKVPINFYVIPRPTPTNTATIKFVK